MRLNSSSFTIFELLIVVVIIASVYTLFIQNINRAEKRNPPLKIEALPKYMESIEPKEIASVICLEDWDERCVECKLYIDGEVTEVEFDFFDSNIPSPRVYEFLSEGRLELADLGKLSISEREFRDICFRFDKRYNNSTSEFVLEYGGEVFIYYPYFQKRAEKVESISLANEKLSKIRSKLKEVK